MFEAGERLSQVWMPIVSRSNCLSPSAIYPDCAADRMHLDTVKVKVKGRALPP